ncbi:hypothetical protein [Rhodopseudomonas pseudopalustris]|uniref:Uncharacterized protein n=1 Tax=Rhodopseudomonas pseudopalustris TaxID=1513892 RepID=A0A1H8WHC0_9BRAD|nr:hypothetical protein [Rhodopseudomonas pseudopalustris]SEP27065.1 hypothetical protein SAMN05444123_11296 [Rhodopseudomonas pseudopalustris]
MLPSLDDLRAARPELSLALYAYTPGGAVTLEILHDGQSYKFTGATVAEAILAAFAPPPEAAPSPPDSDIFD